MFKGTLNSESTLTAGDALDGGAGIDTLSIVASSNGTAGGTGVSTTNIETLKIQNVSTGALVVTSTAMLGLKTVEVVGGTNATTVEDAGLVNIKMTSTEKALTLTNANNLAAFVGETDTVTVTASGVALTTDVKLDYDGVEVVNLVTTGVASGKYTSTANNTLEIESADLETINVSGTAAVNVTATFSGASATSQTGTLDASAAGAGVVATIAAGSTTAGLKFVGSAHNDTLIADITKYVTATGGEGKDTLAIDATGVSYSSTATTQSAAGVSGFEYIESTAGGTIDLKSFVNNKTFEAATIRSGGEIKNAGASLASLDVTGGTSFKFGLATDGTADTLAVSVGSLAGAVSTALSVAEIETLSIKSGGAAGNTISELTSDDLTTLTVTGTKSLTISSTTGAALATVDASGLSGLGTTFTLVASNSNADMTVKVGAGLETTAGSQVNTVTTGAGDDSVTGGAYKDTITTNNGDDTVDGGAGNDVLNGGAGADQLLGGAGDDTLDGDKGDDSLSGGDGNDTITLGTGLDTVDGGAGNDTIYVSDLDDEDVIDGGAGAGDKMLADAISSADSATAAGIGSADFVDAGPEAELQLKNIETVSLQVTASAANDTSAEVETIDFTNSSGLKTLNLDIVDDGDAYLAVKNFDGSAINVSEVGGSNNTGAKSLSIDGVGQNLAVTLKEVGKDDTTDVDGDLVVTGVDQLTITASTQYSNALGVATNISNFVEDITADAASKLTISTGATSAANAKALMMSGAVSAEDVEELVVSVGSNTTMTLGDVSAAGDQAAVLSITVGQDATLTTHTGTLAIDLGDADLDTATIDVGVGGVLEGASNGQVVITADTIDALTVNVGAAATFRADINAGATGTITGASNSVLVITTIGATGETSDITITGRGSLNDAGSGAIASIALVGKDFGLNLSGWTDTDASTTTFAIDGSALTGDATIRGSLVEKNNIVTDDGDDSVFGGADADAITTGAGDDYVSSGAGADRIGASGQVESLTIATNASSGNYVVTINGQQLTVAADSSAGASADDIITAINAASGTVFATAAVDSGNSAKINITYSQYFGTTVSATGGTVTAAVTTVGDNAGDDEILAGLGADTIIGGSGADSINLGAGDAAADLIETLASTDSFKSTSAIVSGTTVLKDSVDLVYGLGSGDKIDLSGLVESGTSLSTVGTSLATALTTDATNLVRGTYDTTTGKFTVGSQTADNDYLLEVVEGGSGDYTTAVIFMDVTGTTVSASITSNVLTFTIA